MILNADDILYTIFDHFGNWFTSKQPTFNKFFFIISISKREIVGKNAILEIVYVQSSSQAHAYRQRKAYMISKAIRSDEFRMNVGNVRRWTKLDKQMLRLDSRMNAEKSMHLIGNYRRARDFIRFLIDERI